MAADRFGYRLMPHTNHHGFDTQAPNCAQHAADQATDQNGKKCGWREKGEPTLEYMRPCSERRRDYHVGKTQRFVEAFLVEAFLVDAFPVDASFGDQYGIFIDDVECDYFPQTQAFASRLQAAIPRTVITSEILQERVFDLPVSMHWGTAWCGLPVREEMPHSDLIGALFDPLIAGTYRPQGMPAAVPIPHTWPSYYWYIDHCGLDPAVHRAHAWHQSVGAIPSARVNFREYGIDPVASALLKGGENGARA